MANIIIDSTCGDTFQQVAAKAKISARQTLTAEFEFNGVKCLVNRGTNLEWLFRDYCNSWLMKWDVVGPACLESYPADIQQELTKRRAENETKRLREQQEYEAQQAIKEQSLLEKIKDIPFACINDKALATYKEKNTDTYGAGIIEYADRWARLMQFEMAQGHALVDIAENASSGADIGGITG